MSQKGVAVAPSNIALVKYWGKRDIRRNLPAMGSLSVSLKGLETRTTVEFLDEPGEDEVWVDGSPVGEPGVKRVKGMLSIVREATGVMGRADIRSQTSFPVGAGIASSASGMAAVVLAAASAAGWQVSLEELSCVARLGSGSACRSLFGGFVEWRRGEREDGKDSHGVPLAPPEHWPLDVLVAVVDSGPKKVSSGSGMALTADSSPYYPAWVDGNIQDMLEAKSAIDARDFERLAVVSEASAMKMHAAMMTGAPSILYWRPGTIEVLECLEALRKEHVPHFFTMDAGPNVKVFTPPGASGVLKEILEALPLVEKVLVSGVGPGARILEHEGA